MPEKPKRRNKGKNKRKNKNNRPENNTNNSDVTEKHEESCSNRSDDIVDNQATSAAGNVEQSVPVTASLLDTTCNTTDLQTNDQDLNNNRDINNTTQSTIDPVCQPHGGLVQSLDVPALIPQEPVPCIIDGENVEESLETEAYIVESPEQSSNTKSNKCKLKNTLKSKSLDNDNEPKIVEITEDVSIQSEEDNTIAVIDTCNVLVSDVESDVEWENADELHDAKVVPSIEVATAHSTVSIPAVPLSVAQCQQTKPLTPEMEISLRNYLKTLDLSTHPENIESVEIKAEIEQIINREIKHRLRKKALADDFGLQRLPPRMLDVIDEEGSSESSITSRRQSYLSDKKSDVEDLEDDVFEDVLKSSAMAQKVATAFPKNTFGRLVPQQCVLVGAKIKDPEVTEARGNWTMRTVEKMTGAEVVYLTDSSSSTSSLHDYGDEVDDGVETDVSVRMITPTIEVTDTESLLKKTFLPETNNFEILSYANTESSRKNTFEETLEKSLESNDDNNSHEIIVLSTDNLKTNLYVKDIQESRKDDDSSNTKQNPKVTEDKQPADIANNKQYDNHDLEMKILKCELNDAINNLIKEVSDSEIHESSGATFARQDSSSSVCSSQCTAKYNPTHSSLNDVSNVIVHDDILFENNKPSVESSNDASHVKEVVEHVTGTTTENKTIHCHSQPLHLRDICVKRIAKFPYGDKILEELASVSKRIQNIASRGFITTENSSISSDRKDVTCYDNMPYFAVPDLSSIGNVISSKTIDPVPPPVQPRHSSLKKKAREEDTWNECPKKNEPRYVCLSPSQKMLMEKTNTVFSKNDTSEIVNTHKSYIDRTGTKEYYKKENFNNEPSIDITPISPFKSQTGSRLLALIRDPTLTNSINSINKHCDSGRLERKLSLPQNLSTHNSNSNKSTPGNLSGIFKPIPPPRPKKMSVYESDESSDFTDSSLRSMKSERKVFHFSTGNLSKEIEDDVSSIQQMHRNYTNVRDKLDEKRPRRPSLPKDICDQQMEYIRQKEKEVEAEIRRLEAQSNRESTSVETKSPRAPFMSEKEFVNEKFVDSNNYFISRQRDFFASTHNSGKLEKHEKGKLSSVFSRSQEELLREKMYSEYVSQMAEREERKQHKVIKITNTAVAPSSKVSKSMPALDILDSKVNNRIEKEFICKARERWDKLGIKDPETEDERDSARSNVYKEPKVIEHKIKVIEGDEERDMKNLPRHLQEFVRFTAKDKEKKAVSSGESESRPASPHVMIWCAIVIIVLAVGRYFFRLLRNK